MADYYPLITRAVAALEKSTGEGRRTLYERARNALVEQLRSVTPALSETDITRERLALEEAIRKVEAEAVRQLRLEQQAERSMVPPLPQVTDLDGEAVPPFEPAPPERQQSRRLRMPGRARRSVLRERGVGSSNRRRLRSRRRTPGSRGSATSSRT